MKKLSSNFIIGLFMVLCILMLNTSGLVAQESENIAKTDFDVIILPSSQSVDTNLQIERAIDGNSATSYVSDVGTYPNWFEARWQQPVFLDRIMVDFDDANRMDSYKVVALINDKWIEIASGKHENGGVVDCSFKKIETRRIKFYMLNSATNTSSAVSSIRELQVFGSADWVEAKKQMTKPWWKSQWIWYPEGEISEVTRYFRKHFKVDDPQTIKQAILQIGVDDGYDVYFNENYLGKGGWMTTSYDVTKYLKQGDNLIAVKCREEGYFEGLIAELTLNKKNDSMERILSDKTWLAYDKDVDNWFGFSIDDSSWKPAKEQGIPPNCLVRTDQPYFDVAAKEPFYSKSFKASTAVKPGKMVKLDFEVKVNIPLDKDYGFVVNVGDKPLNPYGDYTIASKEFMPTVSTSKWVVGKTYKLSTRIYIPDWAPHGDFPVTLTPTGDGVEGSIKNGKDNIVGSLRIQKFASDPKPWPAITPKTEVKNKNGEPTLFINGKHVDPYIMTHPDYVTYQAIGEQAKAGCKIWRVLAIKYVKKSYETEDGKNENIEYFKMLDQQINCLLKEDPNVYLLVGSIEQASPEWTEKYPEDSTTLSDGRRLQYSLSSERWAKQLDFDFRALVKHLMSQSYSGHVIGVHYEMAQETNYWGYMANTMVTPRDSIILGDFSAEHIRAFRVWLKNKYKDNVEALRSAWKEPSVDFITAYPNIDKLCAEDQLMFKDPAKSRMPIDYWEFHAEEMMNMSIVVAKAVKEASGGKYITGLWGFYGDGVYDGPDPGKMQYMGHSILQKVVKSPYIDYLAYLQSYTHRRWGRPKYSGNLVETISRNGKLPLVEFDVRTFFTPTQFDMRTYSQPESLSVMYSNVWGAALKGEALWWVGFPRGTVGRASVPWFAEESILDMLRKGKKVYNAVYNTPSPSNAEVAVFMNNADVWTMDVFDGYKPMISAQYQTAFFETTKLGAPVDYYELNDITLNSMDQYKVYVFLNAYNLTTEQRNAIKAKVRRAGKTAVWLYGAGYSNGLTLDVANIQDLTGITAGCTLERRMPKVNFESGHTMTANIPAGYTLQPHAWEYDPRPYEIGPIFYADDPSVEILGRYAHNGQTAYASKNIDGGKSVFLAIPYISSVVLRDICRISGVHLYSQDDLYLDADSHFVLVTNTENPFNKTLSLPHKATVYDIWNKSIIAHDAKSFTPSIPALKSHIYFYGTDAEVAEFRARLNN